MIKLKIKDIESIQSVAAQFVDFLQSRKERVYCFNGSMGAGKTTFIKAVCEQLGTNDTVNSPTFAIINEYGIKEGSESVYHFDFYRIEEIQEALDIGVFDYFDSGYFCFIEWAENVEELIPEDAIKIDIIELPDGEREITIFDNEKEEKK
ncbi:MAG: tRNA (adenosine(37)-N6)-threonylcarbamoyltransferase complex ATPase subunit type 1 TsaE [Paludibacter sp.]|nr:MAG: tRNA (adenosine(37)-N6)-threonylcarbamoyltransferase complex ATPase subunit type 1 TsaE [Paludibacter sp.]